MGAYRTERGVLLHLSDEAARDYPAPLKPEGEKREPARKKATPKPKK